MRLHGEERILSMYVTITCFSTLRECVYEQIKKLLIPVNVFFSRERKRSPKKFSNSKHRAALRTQTCVPIVAFSACFDQKEVKNEFFLFLFAHFLKSGLSRINFSADLMSENFCSTSSFYARNIIKKS